MKKILPILLLLILCVLVCSCTANTGDDTSAASDSQSETATEPDVEPGEIIIHNITDFNKTSEIDSHADEYTRSHLELSYRDRYFVENSVLGVTATWYPRIKQMNNGEYIMFFMSGQTGYNIYYTRSKDLQHWSATEKIFDREASSDRKMYSSADAIVLENGDIIVAAGYRVQYTGNQLTNGIQIRRSSDNGVTWTDPETIYTGAVWEPSLLQLPSGEVQIYWTNTHVEGSTDPYGRKDDNSTGTAMLRSFDNGKTWNGNPAVPYTAQIVAQQYTFTGSDGKYYSGQMPVATVLNNGKIALALEVRTKTSDGKKTYNLSFAYTDVNNSWPDKLGLDEEGPSTLKKTLMKEVAGPYIRQFPSGETLLTYHWGSYWYSHIGNANADKFNTRVKVFGEDKTDIWGSTEIIDSHTVIGTVPMVDNAGIYYAKLRLNHTIAAVEADITVDGRSEDFEAATDAFFVGSESQAQAAIRVAQDSENIYFVAEVLDEKISSDDKVSFCVGNKNDGRYANISVDIQGKVTVNLKSTLKLNRDVLDGAASVVGTADDYTDKDTGYIVELKIPKSELGDLDEVIFNPILQNSDKEKDIAVLDTVADLSTTNRSNWLVIKLK